MRITLVVTLLTIAIPIRPNRIEPEVTPPTSQNMELLGTWQVVKVFIAGGPDLPVPVEDKRLLFTATDIQTIDKGVRQPANDAAYTVNWNAVPHTIDLVPRQDAGAKRVLAIFKVENEQLTICFGMDGARPANFNDGNGKMATMVLKRVR